MGEDVYRKIWTSLFRNLLIVYKMEENKTKTVEMKSEQKKLSYEELN